ncbi:MAG: hypothetical protein MUP85_24270, partial [Candidatus Lokiarchaeota archaeon]|nr:hypothetical protein [Candidatus Lokiarchaeota archaeon]
MKLLENSNLKESFFQSQHKPVLSPAYRQAGLTKDHQLANDKNKLPKLDLAYWRLPTDFCPWIKWS